MYKEMKIIDQAKLRFYLLGRVSDIGDKSTKALLANDLDNISIYIMYYKQG